MTDINLDTGAPSWETSQATKDYFTCQCNPPFETEREEGSLYAHRIPIDCMTAEDWQRVARTKQERAATVWVVTVLGDVDCGAPNEGVIGVYESKTWAWKVAMLRASEITDDDIEVSEDRIELGEIRGDIFVTAWEVQ